MNAYFATAFGGPEAMRLGELPDPVPGRGEALIRVRAASVNPLDWKLREGQLRLPGTGRFPRVLGTDFAGEVAALGPGEGAGLAPGDRVYGAVATMLGRPGAHAQLVAAPAASLRRMPEGFSFEIAAALPVAGLTALNGLRLCGDLAGRTVLVNGATGGVGHLAVQIAKARGAMVTAVCGAAHAVRARELGADEVVDYRATDVSRLPRRFDVVHDVHGHLRFGEARRILAPRGTLVTTLPAPPLLLQAAWRRLVGGPQVVLGGMRARPEDYAALEELVLSGRVRPVVEGTLPLSRAAEAYAEVQRGGRVGKVVLTIG